MQCCLLQFVAPYETASSNKESEAEQDCTPRQVHVMSMHALQSGYMDSYMHVVCWRCVYNYVHSFVHLRKAMHIHKSNHPYGLVTSPYLYSA